MKRKFKNIILGIIFILLTALICASMYFMGRAFNKNNNEITSPYLHYLEINELKTKINNEDSFILVYIQTGCSHCESYLPVVKKVAEKYKVDFYIINQTNVTETDDKTFLKNVANTSGTPTTVFITNGTELTTTNRLTGEKTEYRLIEKLTNEGYINEE